MTDEECLTQLDQYDVVFYNGQEWLVGGLLGKHGHVREMVLSRNNYDCYARPHQVRFVRKGNGRRDFAQLQ